MNKLFIASELFTIKKGKRLTKANMIDGNINFIGSSSRNNGITNKIGNKGYIHPKGTITVSYNGSVGEVFLQDEPFWASDDVNVWYPKSDMTIESKLYIMTVIKKLGQKYDYANNKWDLEKMKNEYLELPVIENPNPDHEYTVSDIDWKYMHKHIRALEHEYIKELKHEYSRELNAYLQATGLDDYELTDEDESILSRKVNVKAFTIDYVFEPLKVGFTGKGRKIGSATKEPDEEHCIPLTCAKIGDNGIMYWGKKGDFITYTNALSVIADGAVSAGLIYAQPEETGAYSHSYFIDTKAKNVSKYAKMYLSAVLTKVIYPKYSREDAPRWNKIKNDIVYLPITSSGEPDFDYMERYIRSIEKSVIADVVKQKKALIKATKDCIA